MGRFGSDGRGGRGRGSSYRHSGGSAPGRGGGGGAYSSSGGYSQPQKMKRTKYFSKEDYAKKRLARIETDRFRKIKTLKQYEKLLKSEGVTSSERIRIGGGKGASRKGKELMEDEEGDQEDDTSSRSDTNSRSEDSSDEEVILDAAGEVGGAHVGKRDNKARSPGKGREHKDRTPGAVVAAFQKPFAKEMAVAAARRAEKERTAADRLRREEELRLAREAREKKSARYRRLMRQQGRGGAPGLGTLSADIVRKLQSDKEAGAASGR